MYGGFFCWCRYELRRCIRVVLPEPAMPVKDQGERMHEAMISLGSFPPSREEKGLRNDESAGKEGWTREVGMGSFAGWLSDVDYGPMQMTTAGVFLVDGSEESGLVAEVGVGRDEVASRRS